MNKDIQQLRKAIETIAACNPPPGVGVVKEDERIRFAVVRDHFEEKVALVRKLAVDAGLTLAQANLDEMDASISVAETLATVLKELRTAVRWIEEPLEDTVDKHRNHAWKIFTAYYTALAGVAQSDAKLRVEFEELAAFFKVGKRPKAEKESAENEDAEPVKAKESNG